MARNYAPIATVVPPIGRSLPALYGELSSVTAEDMAFPTQFFGSLQVRATAEGPALAKQIPETSVDPP